MRVKTTVLRRFVLALTTMMSVTALLPVAGLAQGHPQSARVCLADGDTQLVRIEDASLRTNAASCASDAPMDGTPEGGSDDRRAATPNVDCPDDANPDQSHTGEDASGAVCDAMLAADNAERCMQDAIAAGFEFVEPDNVSVIAGTDRNEDLGRFKTPDKDLICGFGGDDVLSSLDSGDAFLGGDGHDVVASMGEGFFVGGPGGDTVQNVHGGIFNGDDGNDAVCTLHGGTFLGGNGSDLVSVVADGIFDGGLGDDTVGEVHGGIVNGGGGDETVLGLQGGIVNGGRGGDSVHHVQGGIFNGDEGSDVVSIVDAGIVNGGDGDDTVEDMNGGTFNQ